jgi:hypothetical protein
MAKKGVTPKVAAKKLLTYALEEERDESMKRFDDVLSPGCLSMAEVEEIASNVWKEE